MQASLRTRSVRVDAVLWALTILSGGLTLYWSLGAAPPGARGFLGADKVMHLAAYFVTSGLFFLAAVWRPGRGEGPLFGYRWVLVMALAITGGVVEVMQQAFTDDRMAEFLDWVVEIVAVMAAFGAVMWMRERAEAA